MTKLEYFKLFFELKGYGLKAALQSIVTIQLEDPESSGLFKTVPNAVWVESGKFHTLITGKDEIVEGDVSRPLGLMDDKYSLPGDFHPCLQGQPYDTTFGLFLFNVILFWEVFGDNVPYANKEFTKGLIQKTISNVMVDDPKEGEELPKGKVSATTCMKFTENCYFLEGLGTHFIRPVSVEALVADPRVTKFLKEQFELHKDKLNDPVVFTNILNAAVKMDEAIQLSGPSKNFYIDKKYIDNARKRMFLAFGIEPSANGGWIALKNSLDTGVEVEHLIDYINTSVVGTYSRAKATGDGGSQVKEVLRLIGRALVAAEDCGSLKGEDITIDERNKKGWVNAYQIVKGKPEKITEEIINTLVGKTIQIRVTEYCMTTEGNYCKVCCGDALGAYGSRISAEVVSIPTAQMLSRMKGMHVAGSSIVYLDLATAIKS